MSWRGSANQSLAFGPILSVPFNETLQPPLPWEVGRTSGQSVQGEEWIDNETDPFVLVEDDGWCHMSPAVLTVSVVVCYCITMVLGLMGNICLIHIIAHSRERANVTSIFICNLSISDILTCVCCLPSTVVYTLMDHWVFGSVLCKLVPFIQCVSVTVSVLSLVFIALERHQLIINPSGWKPSVPQAYMSVVLIWMLACLTSLPFLVVHLLTDEPYADIPQSKFQAHLQPHANTSLVQPIPSRYSNSSVVSNSDRTQLYHVLTSGNLEACLEHWPSRQQKLAYTTWLLLFQYCSPLLLVLFCYIRVFVRLRHRKDMLDRARIPESQHMIKNRRINIMLVALITAFAVCWLPLTVFNAVSDWNQEALPVCHHNLLFSLCHLLAMSSTCINPVIYGFLNSNFRSEVREALLQCRCSPVPEEEHDHCRLSTVHMEMSRTGLGSGTTGGTEGTASNVEEPESVPSHLEPFPELV